MKLWHEKLLEYLPDNLLRKLHSDCCEMRSLGGKTRRRGLEYVYDGGLMRLAVYHYIILKAMEKRGWNDDYRLCSWKIHNYRGKRLGYDEPHDAEFRKTLEECRKNGRIYAEHDNAKLLNDIAELKKHGISLPELELKTLIFGESNVD